MALTLQEARFFKRSSDPRWHVYDAKVVRIKSATLAVQDETYYAINPAGEDVDLRGSTPIIANTATAIKQIREHDVPRTQPIDIAVDPDDLETKGDASITHE